MTENKIAILNKGKDNQYIGNQFNGYDIGIQDEGEGTVARNNKFFGTNQTKSKSWWIKVVGFIFYLLGKFFG